MIILHHVVDPDNCNLQGWTTWACIEIPHVNMQSPDTYRQVKIHTSRLYAGLRLAGLACKAPEACEALQAGCSERPIHGLGNFGMTSQGGQFPTKSYLPCCSKSASSRKP